MFQEKRQFAELGKITYHMRHRVIDELQGYAAALPKNCQNFVEKCISEYGLPSTHI